MLVTMAQEKKENGLGYTSRARAPNVRANAPPTCAMVADPLSSGFELPVVLLPVEGVAGSFELAEREV